MTGHSHELPSEQSLEHRLNAVRRDLARAEKEEPHRVSALTAEVKKLEAELKTGR